MFFQLEHQAHESYKPSKMSLMVRQDEVEKMKNKKKSQEEEGTKSWTR